MAETLIANTGLQFIKLTNVRIDANDDESKSLKFHEWFDLNKLKKFLGYAYFISSQDLWVSESSLLLNGYLTDGKLNEENIDVNLLEVIEPGETAFSINDIETALEFYENKWLPIPFLESKNGRVDKLNPTNWSRIKFVLKSKEKSTKVYDVILSFDTKSASDKISLESPFFLEKELKKSYELCDNKQLLLNFCDEEKGCGWVNEYLLKLVHNGTLKTEFPSFKYLANYIYLIQYIGKLNILPKINLINDLNAEKIDVDLVLDIGSSRTCGLLFDSSNNYNNSQPFTQVKKLSLQDISEPQNSCSDPFSMRLAFHKANFGEIGYDEKKFVWPSILRLGKEAKRLIYNSKNEDDNDDDKITNHSSPKRYLWDDEESKNQWEYIRLEGEPLIKSIYFEGVSEQFNSDGTLNLTNDFGAKSTFSRKSLMTFVYLEIFAQAFRQINSSEFRTAHGNVNSPRKLKRVIITCPTAMPMEEKKILRQCAEDAAIALSRFYKDSYNQPYDIKMDTDKLEIIPSIQDLNTSIEGGQDLKDWGYDEATTSQLVFLYAEISERYLNKGKEYFELYGKKRADFDDKQTLTIASIDIGGGTTDLMICTYLCSDEGKTVITPTPLFSESFNYAGDDLLKDIIQQVLLEGASEQDGNNNFNGIIKKFLKDKNVSKVEEKLNGFFGINTNLIDHCSRKIRKEFNTQILIPIALRLLAQMNEGKDIDVIDLDNVFGNVKPSDNLINSFNDHFGVSFYDIKWEYSAEEVNRVIINCFDKLILQISSIMYAHGCDFVLLSGQPTSLKSISNLFLKYYPTSPDKIISLNTYRVGRWYPFQNGNGYFENQKSIVAVGAFIGLFAGNLDKLGNFKLNMEVMKQKMLSTFRYIGIYDTETKSINERTITPEQNRNELIIHGLPLYIGTKQLKPDNYRAKPLYYFDFDNEEIKNRIIDRQGITDVNLINDELNKFKNNIKKRMPITVKISRQYRTDREKINIDSIIDKDKEELSNRFFKIKLQTLPESKGYWLDTGEFLLSINTL